VTRPASPLTLAHRLVCIGFEGHELPEASAALLRGGVRTVILFTRNFRDARQLAALTDRIQQAADGQALIMVDQEGGRVQRFRGHGFPDTPSGRCQGAGGMEAVTRANAACARALRAAGIRMNLAPVLDVDSNPANPVIGDRAFGSDPSLVAACGVAAIAAMQGEGVLACGKHFPGHGDTSVDSHLDLPVLPHDMDRLRRVELQPFVAAIRAGIDAIMTAHVRFDRIDPQVPATLSPAVIGGLLRGELGFDGVVITDDFEMQAIAERWDVGEAAVRAVEAGCDLVLVCHRLDRQERAIQALAGAIDSQRLSLERMRRSSLRIQRLLDRPDVTFGPEPGSRSLA
jgi:beta-N-acetylhexosaminidase